MSDYIARQVEERNRAFHQAKELLDAAAAEKRDLTATEEETYGRIMADMDRRSEVIKTMLADEDRSRDIDDAVRGHVEARPQENRQMPSAETDNDILRKIISGELRSHTFERRDLNTVDDSSIVPQGFRSEVGRLMQYQGPMLDGNITTKITTSGGNDIKWPLEATRPAGTAIAEATEIIALDPTYSSVTLKSQKIAVLTRLSREIWTDQDVNLSQLLAATLGKSLGIRANALLTVGTGTYESNGIVFAAGSGVTGGTNVSGAFTADNLIDLAYSVDSDWVRQGAGYMMRRSSLGALRKLKDTAGQYLYVPAQGHDSNDSFNGFPVYENPDVVATATSAKSVIFGNFSSYLVREVGGLEIARSDDRYFETDEVGVRAIIRIWGDLGSYGGASVKYFAGGAT
jgi:HK97 family phage major capsid protein